MWNANNNHPEVTLRSHSQLFDCPKVPVGKVFGLLGMFLVSCIKNGLFVCSVVQHYHGASGEGTRDDESPACSSFLAASVADSLMVLHENCVMFRSRSLLEIVFSRDQVPECCFTLRGVIFCRASFALRCVIVVRQSDDTVLAVKKAQVFSGFFFFF